MKEEKWLIRKSSGSKAKYKIKGDYANDKSSDLDFNQELPLREKVKTSKSSLDTSLVKRWLNNYIDRDFDEVYSEFLKRVQPKYLQEYKNCIFWYVERRSNVSFDENGSVYGIFMGKAIKLPYSTTSSFYVDPENNLLKKIPDLPFQRDTDY